MPAIIRTPHLPPPGRPGWIAPKNERLELLYLSWGWRRFGDMPQFSEAREGWIYFTLKKGRCFFLQPDRSRVPLKPGVLQIVDPNCPWGYDAGKDEVCDICTWVWRSPPRWKMLRPRPVSWLSIDLRDPWRSAALELHRETREEIQATDEMTQPALDLLRARLDLLLARSVTSSQHPASDAQRLALAVRWIAEHLDSHSPVAGLCDYLLLSPATINRLFRRTLGCNIRDYAKARRLKQARILLAKGASVKEAAYQLGYGFPNDLSRALRAEGISRDDRLS